MEIISLLNRKLVLEITKSFITLTFGSREIVLHIGARSIPSSFHKVYDQTEYSSNTEVVWGKHSLIISKSFA